MKEGEKIPDEFEQNIDALEWHKNRIISAINSGDKKEVVSELLHSFVSGYDVVDESEPVKIGEEEFPDLFLALENFFLNKIESSEWTIEERINFYKKFLPYDYVLAEVFIKRIGTEDSFEQDTLLNPEELYPIQEKHYQWLVDNKKSIAVLKSILEEDGHLDDGAPYALHISTVEKIVDYAKKILEENKNDKDFQDDCADAKSIIEALEEKF